MKFLSYLCRFCSFYKNHSSYLSANGIFYFFTKKILLLLPTLGIAFTVLGQDCNVNFPGTSNLNYSGACSLTSIPNLNLGNTVFMGDNDTFTFDSPSTVNILGDLTIYGEGSGKIIIPAGVTVNVTDNILFIPSGGGCNAGSTCIFEIEVNGTLIGGDNLQNKLNMLVWSGTGSVSITTHFENAIAGCMECSASTCPAFPAGLGCQDNGTNCGATDFCIDGNYGENTPVQNDVTPPVISGCPGNQTVSTTGSDCNEAATWTPPNATDDVGVATFVSNFDPGDDFPMGTTSVIYTAKDAVGNASSCSFIVTVVDKTLPVITNCPADIVVNMTGTNCQEVVSWTVPAATDNCTIASFVSSHNPGDAFESGATTVTYRAMDDSGNSIDCSFKITVNDPILPVITGCPADIIMNLSGPGCSEIVSWTDPVATDNCKIISFVSNHNSGDEFKLGTTTVTYTATDHVGNTAVCNFDVTINDNILPVIADCPGDIVVNLTGSDCEAQVNWNLPTASDNCSVDSFTSSHNSGDNYPLGTTLVTYTVVDPSGNENKCSFTITVEDHIAPVIEQCDPAIIISDYNNALAEAVVSWDLPTASDNCEPVTLLGDHNPGDIFPKGTTTVTYTARDGSGNTITCNFDVEVTGNGVPTAQSKAVLTEAARPIEICMEGTDPDGDPLVLREVKYESTNGQIDMPDDNAGLCFTYTSIEKYEGFETFPVTICDDQNPAACTEVEVQIEVFVDKGLIIYKAFTPDNDNINDQWFIGNIEYYPKNEVMIFDRWGSMVYKATGYDNESVIWDGSSNQGVFAKGKLVPSGTYYFAINLGNGQSIRKGFLEVVQ